LLAVVVAAAAVRLNCIVAVERVLEDAAAAAAAFVVVAIAIDAAVGSPTPAVFVVSILVDHSID